MMTVSSEGSTENAGQENKLCLDLCSGLGGFSQAVLKGVEVHL